MLKTLDEDERLRVVDGDKAEEKVTHLAFSCQARLYALLGKKLH